MRGVLLMNNGLEPHGMREVQRDDELDVYRTDHAAATAYARKHGREVWWHHLEAEVSVALDGNPNAERIIAAVEEIVPGGRSIICVTTR